MVTKALEIAMTGNWAATIANHEETTHEFLALALQFLSEHPVDMLVFEPAGTKIRIRCAGYILGTDTLDETTEADVDGPALDTKFWFKLDDYGDRYVGTFLMPEDY